MFTYKVHPGPNLRGSANYKRRDGAVGAALNTSQIAPSATQIAAK